MGTFYRYTNVVTKGNLGFVGPGQKVISDVKGQTYKPFPVGQPIAYDPFTGLTIDAAGVATAKGIRMGVGHNPDRKARIATQIRHVGSGDIDLCKSTTTVKVTQPGCATPQILDFEFGCTMTGRDYMWQLDIDDWFTRSYYKEGASHPLLFNLRTDITGCTGCSEEANCEKLACQLAEKINGKWIENYPGTSKLTLNTGMPGNGVWAVQKFTSTTTFTLADSAVVDTCGAGCAVKALKGMTGTGLTALVFEDVVDPTAVTQTLVEQLPSLISQINTWLAGKGSAYVKKIDCCTYEIEVNSCLATVAMTYHDDAVVSKATVDAFNEYTVPSECVGCSGDTTDTYTCGVRIYIDPLELPCNCQYPDGNPPSYLGRTATITAWGDGWNDTSYRVVPVQKGTIAIGTGHDVQLNELKQSNGGEGFDYPYGQSYTGDRIPLPLASSAVGQASVADCESLYCIWSLVIESHFAASQRSRHVSNAQSVSFINVPRADTVTIGAMEDMLTALSERGFCSSAQIECIPASS